MALLGTDALLRDLGLDRDRRIAIPPGLRVLAERSKAIAPFASEVQRLERAGGLQRPLDAIGADLVHMWLNRLLQKQPRRQEAVIWALLARLLRDQARGTGSPSS